MQLQITKDTSTNDLERWIGGDDKDFKIEFLKSSDYPPGFLVALNQFILSKIRKEDSITLRCNVRRDAILKALKQPYNYYHLAVPVLFSDKVTLLDNEQNQLDNNFLKTLFIRSFKIQDHFYSQDIEEEITRSSEFTKIEINEFRTRFFSQRSTRKVQDSFSFLTGCYDHLDKIQLDKNYYLYSGDALRYARGISSWLSRLFHFSGYSIKKELGINDLIDDLSVVIQELFHNTHEWARTNFNDTEFYSPGFRGTYINLFLDQSLKKESFPTDLIFNNYLYNLFDSNPGELEIPNRQGDIFKDKLWGVCEISVLDTGPGMARRRAGIDYHNLTEEREIKEAEKCFNKYMTSDLSGRRHVRGRGLFRVISIIGRTGLIRVRTGNVCLYRNFKLRPLIQKELDDQEIMFNSLGDQHRQEGTSISILYPFTYEKR